MVGPRFATSAEIVHRQLAWDKESTHTNDRASFLPIEAAAELASEGLFGGLTARFHGVKEDGAVWRARYGRVNPTDKERLLKLGEERRRQQAMAKQILAERAASEA